MSAVLRKRGGLVDALSAALDRGGHGLVNAPVLLRRILEDESWREFETQRGEVVRHARFIDFVVTPPLKGLGATKDLIERIVAADGIASDLLTCAFQSPPGRPSGIFDNVQGFEAPTGNTKTAALRRLRKDAPELHAEVLAGRLSAHAAMVKAGFRPRTVTVPVSDPDAVARVLRRNLDDDGIARLISALQSSDGAGTQA